MTKLLTRLRIDEVSAVDRAAGEGTKIVLMKRDDTPRFKPHVERHARRLRKFQEIFEGKDGGDDDAGKRVDDYASTVADLLVESGRFPHRTAALDHLLNSAHGNALLAPEEYSMIYNPGGQLGKSVQSGGQRPAKDPRGRFWGSPYEQKD